MHRKWYYSVDKKKQLTAIDGQHVQTSLWRHTAPQLV